MNLRKICLAVTGLAVCFLIMGPATGEIEGRGFVGKLGLEMSSSYVWRGINKSDDLVIAPTVAIEIDKPKISTRLWSNVNLSGSDSGELTEVHFTADWLIEFRDFGITIGGIYYNYATNVKYASLLHSIDDTAEAFARIEWLGGIDIIPSVTVYYDIDKVEGFYGEVGFEYAPPNYGNIEYGFSTSLGYASSDWNNYYFEINDSTFVNLNIKGYMRWPIDEHVFVTPYVAYSTVVDGDIQNKLSDEANLYAGVGVVMEF